jgi:uncharacterized protein (TIGR03435 family)
MRVRCLVTIFAITILSGLVGAQSPAAERLTFEVASIKRNVSGDQGSQIRVQPGGQIVVTNNSLFNLIRNAYGTQRFEMVPGPQLPPWIDSDRWDIIAKPPADAPQREEQMQLRLRSLLEDRFKLDARREVREMPIYALVVARSDGQLGPKIKRSGDECGPAAAKARAAGEAAPPVPPGGFCGTRANPNGTVSMRGVPLSNFVRNLGGMTGRFVIDKTGLAGPFDLDLQWTPDQALGAGGALVEVLVVNSAERPTED